MRPWRSEYKRQNTWHVTENCIGITKNNAHKTGNTEPLRLSYAHMEPYEKNNTHTEK